jgi:hypothetical protein
VMSVHSLPLLEGLCDPLESCPDVRPVHQAPAAGAATCGAGAAQSAPYVKFASVTQLVVPLSFLEASC